MTCFAPLKAWKGEEGGVQFSPSSTFINPTELACGQCIGCRLERSRQWATRCMHQASLSDQNAFITLTYEDEHLPWDGSLNKSHFQQFMKRFRWHIKTPIKYLMCGEYGDQYERPHYHALLFGYDFNDKQTWAEKEGVITYTSEELQRLWPWGFTTTGEVTWQSAAYVSRYCLKKKTGKEAEKYYKQITPDMEIRLEPEYITCSNGLAKEWYGKYKNDCYPSDYITHKGKKLRVPKYYDKLLEKEDPEAFERIKQERKKAAKKWAKETTISRLRVREKCTNARVLQLKRQLKGLQ